jgi:transcription initiation factor IIE alpha subunit
MSIDDRTLKRIPRYTGRDADAERTELDHFGNCPHCGALVDMRDLRQVIEHVHDQWDEIIDEDKSSPWDKSAS